MEEKKVIIIGAGISGLCAGSYLQMNGYKTEIFELHSIPGGLCTAWKRKGYTFDGCIHWLVGSGPSNSFHKLWRELGAVQDIQMVDFDIYTQTEYEPGKFFNVYTDADKLEAEMMRLAPEDEKLIKEFTNAIRKAASVDIPVDKAEELFSISDGIKFLFKGGPLISIMRKYSKITLKEYSQKFKNPLFRENFSSLLGLYENFPAMMPIMMLAWMHQKSAGYPIGGSLEFAKKIENTYIRLGGKVNYNSKVAKILVEKDKAVGIRLENGMEYKADTIISAADGHFTIYDMLDGRYVNQEIKYIYNRYEIFHPIIQASFGIARSFEGMPQSISFPLDKPIKLDENHTIASLHIRIYNFDPTLAPKGKTSITSYIDSDYEYWLKLKDEYPAKYTSEKERIAQEVIDALDKKLGNIKSNLEVYDIATPVTYVRYTNNWKASWEGWLPTVDNFSKRIKKTLPGLDNFYMIGQWLQPGGGLPTGLNHGRAIAQILCKRDGKEFKTISL